MKIKLYTLVYYMFFNVVIIEVFLLLYGMLLSIGNFNDNSLIVLYILYSFVVCFPPFLFVVLKKSFI